MTQWRSILLNPPSNTKIISFQPHTYFTSPILLSEVYLRRSTVCRGWQQWTSVGSNSLCDFAYCVRPRKVDEFLPICIWSVSTAEIPPTCCCCGSSVLLLLLLCMWHAAAPACTARTHPAWRCARLIVSTRPKKAWCFTRRTCALAAASARLSAQLVVLGLSNG